MSNLSKEEITVGITSAGNVRALCMCLFSVLNNAWLPHRIRLRLEGEFPSFNDFYLEQAAEFARLAGVVFELEVTRSTGIRAARDSLMDKCQTEWLWMLDDDVIVEPDCLTMFVNSEFPDDAAALQGTKTDLNNRRGYKNFENDTRPASEVKPGLSMNHRYPKPITVTGFLHKTFPIETIDTGNVLFHVERVRDSKARFQVFEDSTNCGGEDTLFAMQLIHAGYRVMGCPWARAHHLDKPQDRYFTGENSARGEAISRSMDLLGMDKNLKNTMKSQMMKWVWPRK